MSALPAWFGVLFLNVLWALFLPTRSGKAVAGFGAFIAALVLLLPVLSARARRNASLSRQAMPGPLAALLWLPFLLPALSLVAAPNIAFWSLDGRAWLILAWLSLSTVLSWRATRSLAVSHPDSRRLPIATALFVMWSSALWLTVVSDSGIGTFVFQGREETRACQFDPLATAFSIWESKPASEHLFLGWRSIESFDKRQPYANHVHPYLLTMYAWVRSIRALAGVAPHVASNSIPFFCMFVLLAGVTTLLARAGLLRNRDRLRSLLLLFVAYGLIVTAWRFWYDQYRFTTDNPYPLLAGVFLFVYAFLLEPMEPVLAGVSASIFVALSPIHAPMAVVAILFCFGRRATGFRDALSRNRVLVGICVAACAAGGISYGLPRLLIAWKGYVPAATSFFVRSGLDGDTTYFSNMVQSILAPCPVSCCWGRSLTDLLFPAFVPLGVFGFAGWRWGEAGHVRPLHLLAFLCTPYLMSMVLFPQSLSIHPYMYDHMLLIPVIVTGVVMLLSPAFEERLSGPRLLGVLLLAAAVIMSNLLGIVQGLAAMPT